MRAPLDLDRERRRSALIMRANGPGRFCQVFLRVIHNFSPSAPFRAGNRAPPHTSRGKWSIRTDRHRHRKTSFGPVGPVDPARSSAWFSFVYAFIGWVCQGAGCGVFRRFTSSFQVGAEGNQRMNLLTVFFDHSLVQDRVTGRPARVGFREGAGGDWLNVVVDRTDVEALDVSRTATTLSRVLANRDTIERFRGHLDVAFHGYSNDPREVHEIPEIRRFCAKLDDAFPFWFYFLSAEGMTLGVIACCLCSVTKVRPGVVSFGPDLLEFLTRHLGALNWLFDNFSLDQRYSVEISGQVTEYFGRFEPMR